ncbi:MAG: hypothetical protein ACR2O4_15080 [Hyphomicrobiaceae bacterium]
MAVPDHPIIALWSHPRSMSTATERIMRERGDMTCFHEPFLADYYLNRSPRPLAHFDVAADAYRTYDEARNAVLAAAENGPVFFKDMSYYVVPHLFEDAEFLSRITHAFLIRDPRRAIASFYRLDPEFVSVEAGLLSQLEHVRWLEDHLGRAPVVMEAEAIQDDPEDVLSEFWRKTGLPPKPDAFQWSVEAIPEDWQRVAGWHDTATSSTGIRPSSDAPPAIDVFNAAAEKSPHLHDILNAHWPAYLALRDRART